MGKVLFSFIAVIVIATMTYGDHKSISVEEKAKISTDIHKQFYSDCIFLVHHTATGTSGIHKRISVEEKVKISNDIYRYFYSDCIFLVHNTGLSDYLKISQFVKFINEEGMMNTVLDFPDIRNTFERLICLRKKPLFIVPYVDDYMKELLSKSSSLVNISQGIWLLFMELDVLLEEFFTDINIPFDCEFLVAQPKDDYILLTEVYKVSPTLPLQTYRFGNWIQHRGLTWPTIGFYQRRNNLYGFALKTGNIKSQVSAVSIQGIKRISPIGFMGVLWTQLETNLNFTTEYQYPSDEAFGGRTINGSWTGVIGMLKRGEAEVSNAVFLMTSDRMDAVAFTVSYLNIRTYLIIQQPTIFHEKWNAFLIPFSWQLWTASLMVIVLITIILGTLYFLGRRYANFNYEDLGYNTALFVVIGMFCTQEYGIRSKCTSMRMIFVTSYLIVVILVAGYSAALISHLTLREIELPFKNFKEFLADNAYRLGMIANSAHLDYFKESKVEVLKKIYKKKVYPYRNKLPKSDFEGMEWVCKRKNYAHITSTYSLIQMAEGNSLRCGFVLVPEAFFPGSVAIAMTKNSHYKGLFNQKLQAMLRVGLITGVFKRYSWKLNLVRETVTVNSITLSDVTPILSILGAGALLSVLIITVERYFNKKRRDAMPLNRDTTRTEEHHISSVYR